MHTLTTDDLQRHPAQLLEEADRGELAVVMRDGELVLLAVPMGGKGLDRQDVRLELASRSSIRPSASGSAALLLWRRRTAR